MWRTFPALWHCGYLAQMLKAFATLCLALFFFSHGDPSARAMTCDNRGASDRLHFGSKVSGANVTICAEYWWPKVSQKQRPATQPKKPITVQKPVPKFFVVTPLRPRAFTPGSTSVTVSERFAVATSAASHFRKNTLLGRLAVVRFTPIRTVWSFGDGEKRSGFRATHSFRSKGTFTVRAVVTYSVKFRFVGTTDWLIDPRGITLQTNPLIFRVRKDANKPAPGKPLLVLYDCQPIQRAGC